MGIPDTTHFSVRLMVLNDAGNALVGASWSIAERQRIMAGHTDADGRAYMGRVPIGRYSLSVRHLGFGPVEILMKLTHDTTLLVHMRPLETLLQEVVVTARESTGLTSASIIDRKAMQHLQPSSFADLLELLPGGHSKDPVLTAANHIRLREVGISDDKYDISSLGTAFLIDGVPVSTEANMQYTTGTDMLIRPESGYVDARRNNTAKGVDMRTISTDQIERVEIVRGISSVQYGDLTSGLVSIIRKRRATPWEARFKADGFSKLFYAGKGFEDKEHDLNLNVGMDVLLGGADPRNRLENYKRYTASVRTEKAWKKGGDTIVWSASADYTGSFDNERADPDVDYTAIDRYVSKNNRYALSNEVNWSLPKAAFIKEISVLNSLSLQSDQINQTKWVQVGSPMAIPDSHEEGEHDGIYLTPNYTSHLLVDGKPLSVFVKAMASGEGRLLAMQHHPLAGVEWTYDKNLGKGQVYDTRMPPSTDMSTRPRNFRDIPASSDFSMFLEDRAMRDIGKHRLLAQVGLRTSTLLGLSDNFTMSGHWYLDPRINIQWQFPRFTMEGKELEASLSAGMGWHTKFPVIDQLYPDVVYHDLVQLNYFHEVPAYRRINLMTFRTATGNNSLQPACNLKKEIRLDVKMGGNNLAVNYFYEHMADGFRSQPFYRVLPYKRYDASGVDHSQITAPPALDRLPYVLDTTLALLQTVANGSRLDKRGVEFQYAGKRLPVINTRFTLNGAWFRTLYRNSRPVYQMPRQEIIIDGKHLQYLGLYADDDSYVMQQLSTNLMADTYFPKAGLEFSFSVQCGWYASKQSVPKNGTPLAYVDLAGNQYAYTLADKDDKVLQWLTVNYSADAFRTERTPFSMDVNFKASKTLKQKARISLFVNRIFSYYPDQRSHGVILRRRGLQSPYFGMELGLTL